MSARAPVPAASKPPSVAPVPGRRLQRKCACGGSAGPGGECAACRQKRLGLQRHPASNALPSMVPPLVHQALRAPGRPLDPATRAGMEAHFGHDFSRVRVHQGARAAASARAVHALAYTVGQGIVFGDGQYRPDTEDGRRLIAHELAHTIQQSAGPSRPPEAITAPDDPSEREAEAAAARVAGDGTARIVARRPAPHLQRQPADAGDARGAGQPDDCSGWEGDQESFSIFAARHVAKTYIAPTLDVAPPPGGQSVTCPQPRRCDVSISNGQVFRVGWEPRTKIALVRFEDQDGVTNRYVFDYSCPGGQLVLTFKKFVKGN